jgi:hypothetical protein
MIALCLAGGCWLGGSAGTAWRPGFAAVLAGATRPASCGGSRCGEAGLAGATILTRIAATMGDAAVLADPHGLAGPCRGVAVVRGGGLAVARRGVAAGSAGLGRAAAGAAIVAGAAGGAHFVSPMVLDAGNRLRH